MSEAINVVRSWHSALNGGEVERLVELSTADIEVGGPRGSGQGVQLLREWFGRAGVTMEPVRIIDRGDRVVVEQRAAWGQGEPQIVASVFVVRDGRVASVVRYPDLQTALEDQRTSPPRPSNPSA